MSQLSSRIVKESKGFTLIELMVSMTISLVILAAIAGSFTLQNRQNSAEEQIGQMQQNVRAALDLMIREIQMAGYKPAGGSFNGIHTSTATTLRIKLDLDSSGVETDGTNDDISYVFNNSTGVITRTLNNSAASATLADNITTFSFTYLDANGASTTTNTAVRRVTINMTARTANPDPSYPTNNGYRTYQITADVTPPNLSL
jgi:type IV pilus assembly protein PilW